LTQHGKRRLGYLEVIEKILKACPGPKTTLYSRSGLTYYAFHSPRYLPLILAQGLATIERDNVHSHTVQRGTNAYIITPKGERYLHLIAEARKILGIE